MEFILGILVGVTAWPAFWFIFTAAVLILSAFVVNEKGGWSTIFTIVVAALLAAKWQDIVLNPIPVAAGLVGYLVFGIIWSRFKWSRYLTSKFEYFKNLRDGFLLSKSLPTDYFKNEFDRPMLDEYVEYIRQRNNVFIFWGSRIKSIAELNAALAPKAADNKGSIVMWIVYWPVFLVWYLLADIVRDIGRGLYNMVGGHFQKMSTDKFEQL